MGLWWMYQEEKERRWCFGGNIKGLINDGVILDNGL